MSSVHSAVYSTPVKFAFGALSALSYKNAYQASKASGLESKYQKILTKVMGEAGGRVSQIARRTSEVALWAGLGTLYALIAIAKPIECPIEHSALHPSNHTDTGFYSEGCRESDFFSSILNGVSHMDNLILGGAGKKVSEFVQNNRVTIGITAFVGASTAYFFRRGRQNPLDLGRDKPSIIERARGAAIGSIPAVQEGSQSGASDVGESAPVLQEGVETGITQNEQRPSGSWYLRTFCWVANGLSLSDTIQRRLLVGCLPELSNAMKIQGFEMRAVNDFIERNDNFLANNRGS